MFAVSTAVFSLSAMPGNVYSAVATKAYVDRIVVANAVQSDWNQIDDAQPDYIKNKPGIPDVSSKEDTSNKLKSVSGGGTGLTIDATDIQYPSAKTMLDALSVKADTGSLAPVAFSGSYNDLINKPTITMPGHEFAILSASKTNAKTDDEFYFNMDGLRFRAYKASTTNYWGLRIVNNTGSTITYGSRGFQMYSGMQMNNKGGTLAAATEVNPDTEANDIGYSKEDVFVTYFTDMTNMHFYRWTVGVNVKDAIMILERLY